MSISKLKLFTLSSMGLFVAVGVAVLFLSPKAFADVTNNNLMDDGIFLNANAISASQIQNFLNTEGGAIASMTVTESSTSETLSYYPHYNQTVSVAQAIYDAGQVYGINPQVILATMQKEQSLVTDPAPASSQLRYAMGYGCPDSAGCSNAAAGLFYQIDNGTWDLRFLRERSNGNNTWWNSSLSYPCDGSNTTYYNPGLYPGQYSTFYDDNHVAYTGFVIANTATASFYCYTPHAYNNPQGLYGNPQYGTTGMYYSGSYNFDKFFELWFGSIYTIPYYATYSTQSSYPTLYQGQTATISITYRNLGSKFWKDDLTSFPGAPPVRLATAQPVNRTSPFYDSSWESSNRPTGTLSAVYQADGTTLTSDQHTVFPGQYGVYTFKINVPATLTSGTYQEYFQLVADGDTNWNAYGLVYQNITVKQAYQAQYVGQSNYPTINQSDSKTVYFEYKNVGGSTWKDDTSVGAGEHPIHLAASTPINRVSPFYDNSWGTINRPSTTFGSVYESDGTTLAANQHQVSPGQIAKFNLTLTAGTDATPQKYREFFQPIVEGAPNWEMGGVSFLDVTVQGTKLGAAYSQQSPYPTIARGSSAQVYVQFKNSGTEAWFDDTSKTGFIDPMRIATSSPINHSSPFQGADWLTNNRPAGTLSAVYNSDGSSATNQHVVYPGQYGRYAFTLNVPANATPGSYIEYFQLIAEGSKTWDIGSGSAVWLQVNVN